jgi:FkbM family methyltransferase
MDSTTGGRALRVTYDIDPTCQLPHDFLATLYDGCFRGKAMGHYVEVGAYDGVQFGHTSALAKLGWRGLCIEPHPEYADRCRKNHEGRNVVVENCAIGATQGEATLFISKDMDGACSSTKWTDASRVHGLDTERSIKVPLFRLDTVLEKHNIPVRFDVLTIDVEEAEMEVLAGFDLIKWMPKIAIVETHEHDPNPARSWKAMPIGLFFGSAGYQKVYADHINSVFVRP